jgi:uncharacterized protein YjbJ (UPF0337 family)
MIITVELLRKWDACYPDERLRELVGDGLTPVQVCDLPDVSVSDKLWVLLREDILSARTLRLLACTWAERVLPVFERERPGDVRPRDCLAVARRYAEGQATGEELAAARGAAWAARDAAWDAAAGARDAARGAAWAARDAAWAARDAAGAARDAAGAARDAAGGAAGAARDAAAGAGDAAWGARDAAMATQLTDVRAALVEVPHV